MLAAGGNNPVWRSEPLNLAEAAALRDMGEVARLLDGGADPREAMRVRGGFLHQHEVRLTPAEAAILADRPEILQLLVDYGLLFDRDEWIRAWCAATSADMRAVLVRGRPTDATPACGAG